MVGNGEIGFQGETGTGVGCVCNSDPGVCVCVDPGSRNEKKLCDNECLWWCPLLLLLPEFEPPAFIGGGIGAEPGGRAPNVKPAPRGVIEPFVGAWADSTLRRRLGKESAECIADSSSLGISSSCEPSSAIVLCGNDPGLGKNMDRFLECILPCRLCGFCSLLLKGSGALADAGNEADNGEGKGGENGVEIDLVRE